MNEPNKESWHGAAVKEMESTSNLIRIIPAEVLSIYRRHDWRPMSGQFWQKSDGGSISCCGAAAVALEGMPGLIEKVISTSGDTARASPALLAVAAAIHAELTYTWDFTLGFDRGFDEVIATTPTGITLEELDLRERSGIHGVNDGLESGRLVATWWKEKTAA